MSNWTLRRTTTTKKLISGGFTVFGVAFRVGIDALATGDTSRTVTLTKPMPSTTYAVFPAMLNSIDPNPMKLPFSVKIISTTQFQIVWDIPLDAPDGTCRYSIMFLAIGKNTT